MYASLGLYELKHYSPYQYGNIQYPTSEYIYNMNKAQESLKIVIFGFCFANKNVNLSSFLWWGMDVAQ